MSDESSPPSQSPSGVSRRTAVKIMAVGTIGAAVGAGATALVARREKPAAPRYYFFTEEEAAPLIAFCERIIPRDDTPGATEAGVIDFIDRQLVGVLSRHQHSYRAGLDSLRRTSFKLHGLAFDKIPAEAQDNVLRLLESGKTPGDCWGEPGQQSFFNLVLDHTRQGFYGSPRHGGNRDYTSYRMMGLAYPNIVGQDRRPSGGRV
ncbi:MAG: gluconate 2-dehydrogenase subunit 3 family protein [Opitutaceae bacterium]